MERAMDMLHGPLTGNLIRLALPIALSSMLQQVFNAADTAVVYLRIYLMGYPALMLYDFGAGILRARGDSRRPFYIITASGGLNVLLNLMLVIGCKMGVAGVAIAADISSCFAAAMVLWLLALK